MGVDVDKISEGILGGLCIIVMFIAVIRMRSVVKQNRFFILLCFTFTSFGILHFLQLGILLNSESNSPIRLVTLLMRWIVSICALSISFELLDPERLTRSLNTIIEQNNQTYNRGSIIINTSINNRQLNESPRLRSGVDGSNVIIIESKGVPIPMRQTFLVSSSPSSKSKFYSPPAAFTSQLQQKHQRSQTLTDVATNALPIPGIVINTNTNTNHDPIQPITSWVSPGGVSTSSVKRTSVHTIGNNTAFTSKGPSSRAGRGVAYPTTSRSSVTSGIDTAPSSSPSSSPSSPSSLSERHLYDNATTIGRTLSTHFPSSSYSKHTKQEKHRRMTSGPIIGTTSSSLTTTTTTVTSNSDTVQSSPIKLLNSSSIRNPSYETYINMISHVPSSSLTATPQSTLIQLPTIISVESTPTSSPLIVMRSVTSAMASASTTSPTTDNSPSQVTTNMQHRNHNINTHHHHPIINNQVLPSSSSSSSTDQFHDTRIKLCDKLINQELETHIKDSLNDTTVSVK